MQLSSHHDSLPTDNVDSSPIALNCCKTYRWYLLRKVPVHQDTRSSTNLFLQEAKLEQKKKRVNEL